jgi:hypothetical protein
VELPRGFRKLIREGPQAQRAGPAAGTLTLVGRRVRGGALHGVKPVRVVNTFAWSNPVNGLPLPVRIGFRFY